MEGFDVEARKLSVRTKFSFGLGASSEIITEWAFANLLLFYFERIWGVPGFLVVSRTQFSWTQNKR